MKNINYILFAILVILESIIITSLIINLLIQRKINPKRKSSISIINANTNPATESGNLKYYYEPIAFKTEWDSANGFGRNISWTYNSDTLNDRFEYSIDHPSYIYRIVTLGDSFTFGDHVKTEESWPEKLEDMLNEKIICRKYTKYEVINLGVRGYDIQYSVERFIKRGQKYTPNLIIWFLINNDFEEINEIIKPKREIIKNRLRNSGITDELFIQSQAIIEAYNEYIKEYDQEYILSMIDNHFINFSDKIKNPLIIAILPKFYGKYFSLVNRWRERRNNTYIIDTLPDIYNNSELNFGDLDNGHPNPQGHKEIAVNIYENIINLNIIPCQN